MCPCGRASLLILLILACGFCSVKHVSRFPRRMFNVVGVVFLRIWGQSSGGSKPSQCTVGTARFPQAFPKRQTRLWQPAAWSGPAVPALLHGYGHNHQCRGTFIKPWSWGVLSVALADHHHATDGTFSTILVWGFGCCSTKWMKSMTNCLKPLSKKCTII